MSPDTILRREILTQRLERRKNHAPFRHRKLRILSWLTPHTNSEEGATLVEFALTVTMLLILLFGTIVVCTAFYTYNVVTNAAKAGTRYAIVRGAQSCADSTPGCDATSDSIQDYVRGLGFPGINPANLTATANWFPTTAGATCTPSTLCNNPGNQVQVQVQYTFPFDVPFVPSQTLTMKSTSQMVISQ